MTKKIPVSFPHEIKKDGAEKGYFRLGVNIKESFPKNHFKFVDSNGGEHTYNPEYGDLYGFKSWMRQHNIEFVNNAVTNKDVIITITRLNKKKIQLDVRLKDEEAKETFYLEIIISKY